DAVTPVIEFAQNGLERGTLRVNSSPGSANPGFEQPSAKLMVPSLRLGRSKASVTAVVPTDPFALAPSPRVANPSHMSSSSSPPSPAQSAASIESLALISAGFTGSGFIPSV